jgi:hypothetical protein
MSVYKRNGVWWYSFIFAGRRIQESAKTSSKTLSKEAERNRRRELEEGYNGITAEDKSHRVRSLHEAADAFLQEYKLRCRETSYSYADHAIRHLKRHIGNMMLIEIAERTILEYRSLRLKEKASGKTINEEVRLLLQIMGDLGDPIRLRLKRHKKLRIEQNANCGKALSLDEETMLLDAAKERVRILRLEIMT